jgi:alkanesulfonate monooxygenase
VFPLLPRKQRPGLPGETLTGPFGEVVANLDAPSRLLSQS